MTTYYDYLKDRMLASSVRDAAQLEQLIHHERNALWQQIVANPAYDERSRMATLAAFDEAASFILSEQNGRFGRAQPQPSLEPQRAAYAPEEPSRARSIRRDILFFLIGAAVGVAVAYAAGGAVTRMLSSADAGAGVASEIGVQGFEPTQKSFKFVKSQPSPLEGAIDVVYASGTPSDSYACEVEATYRQILEYAKFDSACKTVTFKFLPLSELWANFNYLEGYMVFSATIKSPDGGKWQGSTSVFFSINATT